MSDDDILQHLRGLEIELHQWPTRSNVSRLDALLHHSFIEFGCSGAVLSKVDVLERLPADSRPRRIWSESFELSKLADNVALLTYRSANADASGALSKHALRSSLWIRTPRGWQIRFHQGTPTDAFLERGSQPGGAMWP